MRITILSLFPQQEQFEHRWKRIEEKLADQLNLTNQILVRFWTYLIVEFAFRYSSGHKVIGASPHCRSNILLGLILFLSVVFFPKPLLCRLFFLMLVTILTVLLFVTHLKTWRKLIHVRNLLHFSMTRVPITNLVCLFPNDRAVESARLQNIQKLRHGNEGGVQRPELEAIIQLCEDTLQ